MEENTYRKKTTNTKKSNKTSFLPLFSSKSKEIDAITRQEVSSGYIPYILYLAILGVLYIANAHYAEKMVRETTVLEAEVENLRADHTTLKAEYDIYISKQSEIVDKAKELGLSESKGNIQKIIVEKSEY